MSTPEQLARVDIDKQLIESGWIVQNRDEINLSAGSGVAIREFKLQKGFGFADYLLFVGGAAVGVLEAKAVGHTLHSAEPQAEAYSEGLPDELEAPYKPLPFCYLSTGAETVFFNRLDPSPRSRPIFRIHRPETLSEWLEADTLDSWVKDLADKGGLYTSADDSKPSTLRSRIQTMPPVHPAGLWRNQIEGITNLDISLKQDKPRALIQMATGSGKTFFAVNVVYRLIKFGGANRILFLVDRGNLGTQAHDEFADFRTPDDNRKFGELYNVQLLSSATIGSSSKVVISTIQRLYSMLKGEELDPDEDEKSLFDDAALPSEPLPVVYNEHIPPEYFDIIIVDECHRSIYSLWRQVLEYFDAYLIGLTATPAKHTFGFFNQNLVMEYGHDEAVADGVNVDFEIYRIRTKITVEGSTIESGFGTMIGKRDRRTRTTRWEQPDEDISYTGAELDRNVVARDQIRLVIRTLRDRLPVDLFPGRTEVPKTLIFAKDDSHAEDIVTIVREEFGKGNDFCRKITYKSTGAKPKDLIQEFRNSYHPRIAVTVDMIATGTDIKPVEVVVFMRSVKSRVLFEQMKGRGVRIIDENEFRAVTPDASRKTHFIIVDCVGISETPMADTQPLERKRSVSFKKLLEHVAVNGTDPDYLSSLASRLARLDKQCGEEEKRRISDAGGGIDIGAVSHAIINALDPDAQVRRARKDLDLSPGEEPPEDAIEAAEKQLLREAVKPIATRPELRKTLVEVKQLFEQIIDEVSRDELIEAGLSPEATLRAKSLVADFEQYLKDHADEIDALQFFYSRPYRNRLRFSDIKALHEAISAPPRSWTSERLWRAYEMIEANKVRGAAAGRRLTDIVSLIRFALHQTDELSPFAEVVSGRFDAWLAQQRNSGRVFTDEQLKWLGMIRDHVAQSVEIDVEDFELMPFSTEGGLGKAAEVFGKELRPLIDELNRVLVA